LRIKYLIIVLISLRITLSSFSAFENSRKQTINFKIGDTLTWYSFNEGHSKAIRENKILLVNVSTEWCYPCQMMKKNTFTHTGVIDSLNKYFVCVYLNPEIEASYTLHGKNLTPKELVTYLFVDQQVAYPSSIFWFHPESKEKLSVHSGYMEPTIYLKLLGAARDIRPISSIGINLTIE